MPFGSVDRGCWVQWIEDVGSRATYGARDAGRAFLARCTLGPTSKARASHLPLPISGISALNRRRPAVVRFAGACSDA